MRIGEVAICNLALSRVGEKANVVSINPTDGTELSEACARFYPLALGAVLEAHPWSFATKRVTLAQRQGYISDPWLYAFSAPDDFARTIDVRGASGYPYTMRPGYSKPRFTRIEYAMEADAAGLVFLANEEQVMLRYVVNNPKPVFFPFVFVDALAWRLAGDLAGELIKSDTGYKLSNSIEQNYIAALTRAVAYDQKNHHVDLARLPKWIAVR
jgi:hypothetical protein